MDKDAESPGVDAKLEDAPSGQWPPGPVALVWRVLDRHEPIDPFEEMQVGLKESSRPEQALGSEIAFGFDANAVFRVGGGDRGADALDYLQKIHHAPVIIPGQVVQEFWNNRLAVVVPFAKNLGKKLQDLIKEAESADLTFGEEGEAVRDAIDALNRVHGDWLDPDHLTKLASTLAVLRGVGVTSYVPRSAFATLARVRKETKTPPGFKDSPSNHGDFFVWADFLLGLALADPTQFQAAVFVTNDVKSDWSHGGMAHPVLVAEAQAVIGKPFQLWTVERFHDFVSTHSS